MVAEQRRSNGHLACFDDKTLAETWVTCTVFIDALYRDIDYNDTEQMAHAGLRRLYDIASLCGDVLLGCPHGVFHSSTS
eukprot:6208441-Pleurochrysis_carterae.AAC.2